MQNKESPITSGFLGMVKKSTCPCCNIALSWGLSIGTGLCPNCGEYLDFDKSKKNLRQADSETVRERPFFAAPTPWDDIISPLGSAISLSAASAVTDMLLTKKDGIRVLEANWPEGCCVCDKPATREEKIVARYTFTPPGVIRVGQKQVTLVANGCPHCAEHKNGASFDIARFINIHQPSRVGLLFRSYSWQIKFRRLNPWKWTP